MTGKQQSGQTAAFPVRSADAPRTPNTAAPGRIFVFAGTADGRALVSELLEAGFAVTASVVSRYGGELLEAAKTKGHDLVINEEPLDEAGLIHYCEAHTIAALVDASHPYAVNVSQNAMAAAQALHLRYVRYERDLTELTQQGLPQELLHIVHSYEEAAETAGKLGDVLFLTTGSRNLKAFKTSPALQGKTLIARVLPTADVLAMCSELGFTPGEIVAVQGPFSEALNRELFRQFHADVIVTKNSGSVGGTDTKLQAAGELGLPVVVIDRPKLAYPQIARTFAAVKAFLEES